MMAEDGKTVLGKTIQTEMVLPGNGFAGVLNPWRVPKRRLPLQTFHVF
jgi:hypothetical protein